MDEPDREPPLDPDLQTHDAGLLQSTQRVMDEATRRAGTWLVCRAGCFDCCVGPFPINTLDAWRLRRGLSMLQIRDPEKAGEIAKRAREAIERLRDDYPGDPRTGRLSSDDRAQDRFFERHAAVPCPALDPQDGTCGLYDHRPMSCRTYGPPVAIGVQALAPCRLCFDGAPQAEVERCRVEPDPEGQEERILRRTGEGETIIAFALADTRTRSGRPRGD